MVDRWYYGANGQQRGPTSYAELRKLASDGQLHPEDLVWTSGWHQWAPASTVRGLFATPPAPAPAPIHAAPTSLPGLHAQTLRPPPRPRRAASKMTSGAKVALFGGVLGCVLLIALVVVLVLFLRRSTPRLEDYSLRLDEGAQNIRVLRLGAGKPVTITVTSDRNTDVDLHVFDARGGLLANDIRPDKDCFVTFVPPQADFYQVEIVNLGPGFNRCFVRVQEAVANRRR